MKPTAAERRIAKAEAAYEKRQKECAAASKAFDTAMAAARKKHRPIYDRAQKEVVEACKALWTERLAAHGITPGKTVVLYHPRFTSPLSMLRYVVEFTSLGYVDLHPVTKAGKIMQHRNPEYLPSDLSRLIRTDDEVTE